MERRSTNENIEHFLRQNAEDFKMHPSPKVWEGISENLNKRKRRFYLGVITLLVSSSILGYTILEFSTSKLTKLLLHNPLQPRQLVTQLYKKMLYRLTGSFMCLYRENLLR